MATAFPSQYWTYDSYRVWKDMPITKYSELNFDAHYSDPRYQGGKEETIFGAPRQGLSYVYSDRLGQWDRSKNEQAWKTASEAGLSKNSAAHREKYLSEYFGKPCELEHIIIGVNCSNGYPYVIYGYTLKEDNEPGPVDQSPGA